MNDAPQDPHYGFLGRPLHPTRCVAVLDTDHLLNELQRNVKSRPASTIDQAAMFGSVRLFAAAHVFDEVYAADAYGHANKFEKLAKQDRQAGGTASTEQFREAFEQDFLPRIRFVELPDNERGDPLVQAVAREHESDVPTAQLAMLLGPTVVLSLDKHLRRPGIAPADIGPVTKAAQDVAAADGALIGMSAGTVFGFTVIGLLLNRLALFLKVPKSTVWGGAALLGVWTLKDSNRREKAALAGTRLADGVGHILEQAAVAEQVLDRNAIASSMPVTLDRRLARELLRSASPLLASELVERLARNSSAAAPTVANVRAVLTSHPAFCYPRGERYRYQLGLRRFPPNS